MIPGGISDSCGYYKCIVLNEPFQSREFQETCLVTRDSKIIKTSDRIIIRAQGHALRE